MLRQTLEAFRAVTVPPDWRVELIIADNGSTDDTAEVIRSSGLDGITIRGVYEPRPGKSRAQNAAMAVAGGRVLLFTDDDVEPAVNWIEEMARPLLEDRCDAVAGRILLADDLRRAWFTGIHLLWLAEVREPAAENPELVGASMGIKKSVFEKIDNFDENIGPGASGFGEETLLWWQMIEAGFRIQPVNDTHVVHHPEASRLLRSSWLSAAAKQGRSSAYLLHHWKHAEIPGSETSGVLDPDEIVHEAFVEESREGGCRRLLRMGDDLCGENRAVEAVCDRVARAQELRTARPSPERGIRKPHGTNLMAEMLRISVVIPTYNRAGQVPDAVRSVLEQTLPAHEVIVIDDGSTDATEEALAPYIDRIRYIKTENRGVSAARNRGIHESTGDWIAFLDTDDTWRPEKLKRQAECVERTGALVCFCVCTNEAGEPMDGLGAMDSGLRENEERFYPPGDCRMFKNPGHAILLSMMAEKEAMLKSGTFDESLWVGEDHKLIHGLVLDNGYALVNEKLVDICRKRNFVGLSDSVDAAGGYRNYQCYIRVQSELYWRLFPIDAEAARYVMRRMLYFISRQAEIACALGRKGEARRYARAGLGFTGGWKDNVRNLFILGAYPIAGRLFAKKWKT